MKGTPASAHQSHSICGRAMLVAATRSPSVSVVALIAPMWNSALTRGALARKAGRSSGATMPAIGCLARLRHFWPWRRRSTTTTSSPLAQSAAARLEPMNPAPPVTIYMVRWSHRRP